MIIIIIVTTYKVFEATVRVSVFSSTMNWSWGCWCVVLQIQNIDDDEEEENDEAMTGHGGFAFLLPIMNDGEELRRDEYGKKSVDEFIVIHDRMPTCQIVRQSK